MNKFSKAEEMQQKQKKFVIEVMKAQATKAIFWLDETSVSCWSPIKRRTWSNGRDVVLPMQNKRHGNRTVIGAVGGYNESFYLYYRVARRTCKEEVLAFLQDMMAQQPYATEDLIIVTDNHGAHHSKLIK